MDDNAFVQWLKAATAKGHTVYSGDIEVKYRISGCEVRALVNRLRCLGDPKLSRIGSDQGGYYWIGSAKHAQRTITHLRSRAREINKAARGIERAFGGRK